MGLPEAIGTIDSGNYLLPCSLLAVPLFTVYVQKEW